MKIKFPLFDEHPTFGRVMFVVFGITPALILLAILFVLSIVYTKGISLVVPFVFVWIIALKNGYVRIDKND